MPVSGGLPAPPSPAGGMCPGVLTRAAAAGRK